MNASMTTYETFRDKVRLVLKAAGRPLSWTEIRTIAELPQKWPSNQWVRRLEAEIGLERTKDTHGGTLWQLTGSLT